MKMTQKESTCTAEVYDSMYAGIESCARAMTTADVAAAFPGI